MKKILSLFLSLLLVFSTVSCFATVMTQQEIIDEFDDNIVWYFYSEDFDTSVISTMTTGANSYFTNNNITVSNYINVPLYDKDAEVYSLLFVDLGDVTIDSYINTITTDSETGDVSGYYRLVYNGTATQYTFSSSGSFLRSSSRSSLEISPEYFDLSGDTFNSCFNYSSSSIFTDNASSGGLFANIMAIMTSILGFIVPVATGLLAIPLFKFIIYASIALGIVYFVLKLLKSFTGNKLKTKSINK